MSIKRNNKELSNAISSVATDHDMYESSGYEKYKMDESPTDMETTAPPTVKIGIVVNTSFVRVRERASTESAELKRLAEGDKVSIVGEENEFYKILTFSNPVISGYIMSKFIKEV